ncbi:hypothetical protein [Synechococcus sp. CBW1006]|uniref:hypothetical protein n=1 Tax=Synechococcus sp. CBW1006 TaxID=1353138 RepID=UPI0018CC9ED2|nr:hypothetical protein [Synechococcus sp. CBW1006]QPN67064.1 hypothetical protein H8F26_01875 [Synechococcus sp. CBW1006]
MSFDLVVVLSACALDRFRTGHDTFGHQTGDAVLRGRADLVRPACGLQIWWPESAAMRFWWPSLAASGERTRVPGREKGHRSTT